jgi:hypothetical protein
MKCGQCLGGRDTIFVDTRIYSLQHRYCDRARDNVLRYCDRARDNVHRYCDKARDNVHRYCDKARDNVRMMHIPYCFQATGCCYGNAFRHFC